MRFVLPVDGSIARYPKGKLIQGFAENPHLYTQFAHKGHNGWDIVGKYGEPIYAISDGRVFHVEVTKDPKTNGYGNNIIMISDPDENGICIESTYGHMTANHKVRQGDRVRAGQQIGEMGNSGFIVSGGVQHWQFSNPDNRGTHLHLTTKRFKLINGQYQLINSKNGFAGAFDPAELYRESINMKLVRDKGTVYLVAGVNQKVKTGISDPEVLAMLFGDEPIEDGDTSGIPQSQTASTGLIIHRA